MPLPWRFRLSSPTSPEPEPDPVPDLFFFFWLGQRGGTRCVVTALILTERERETEREKACTRAPFIIIPPVLFLLKAALIPFPLLPLSFPSTRQITWRSIVRLINRCQNVTVITSNTQFPRQLITPPSLPTCFHCLALQPKSRPSIQGQSTYLLRSSTAYHTTTLVRTTATLLRAPLQSLLQGLPAVETR